MVAARLTVVLVFPWEAAADWRGLLAAAIAALLPPGTNLPTARKKKKLFSYFLILFPQYPA